MRIKQIETFKGTAVDLQNDMNLWLYANANLEILSIDIKPQFGFATLLGFGGGTHDKHIGTIVYVEEKLSPYTKK